MGVGSGAFVKNNEEIKRAICAPDALLPNECDFTKWSVVACDQFTSDKEYWNKLDKFVGDAPSSLRLILPECYLGESDVSEREASILRNMTDYLKRGIFKEISAYIEVVRTFTNGNMRKGLVAAIDLEQYDFKPESRALIRATEGTVASRLPPRVKIRQSSQLELPHILIFIDDPKNIIFSAAEKSDGKHLYDFDLNSGGGHITGRALKDSRLIDSAFDELKADMRKRYGEDLLLLVGDGNHSLAAAKNCYEKAKAAGDEIAELKRYALCEIVNLYDDGIIFEPIHRAVFGVNPQHFAEKLCEYTREYPQEAYVTGGGKEYSYRLPDSSIEAVAAIEKFIETYIAENGGRVDYIHGDNVLAKLSRADDCVTVPLKSISKSGFTEYIIRNGVLPKKTFSMGHAEEKRYYLEARRIGKI